MVFFDELVLERRANKHTEGGCIKVQWQSPQLYRQKAYLCFSAKAAKDKYGATLIKGIHFYYSDYR